MAWGQRADRERAQNASSRVSILLTKTAATRLAHLAILHQMSLYGLMRSAIEAHVHDDEREEACSPERESIGPLPAPEPASIHVRLPVMPETRAAVKALAQQAQTTQTAVIRSALNTVAIESGDAPLFAERPRAPVPGFSRRVGVGLHRWAGVTVVPERVVGAVFGQLTVTSEMPSVHGKRYVACRCACGATYTGRLIDLRRGHTRSCGCVFRARAAARAARQSRQQRRDHGGRWVASED